MSKKISAFFSMISYYVKQMRYHPEILKEQAKEFYAHIQLKFPNHYSIKHWVHWLGRKANIKGSISTNHKYLVYVIYEPEGRVQTHKLFFLESVAEMFDEILIVSNGELSKEDSVELRKFGQVYTRENVGYDTAAFKFGIEQIGYDNLKKADGLYLINDTVFGPIFSVKHMVETMERKQVDFWGVTYGEKQLDFTNLNRYGYIPQHIQTYFVAIKHSMLMSNYFQMYWQQMNETNTREKAIGFHETVFTKYFEDKGFKSEVYAKDCSDSAIFNHPLNLLKQGVPFVKSSAIQKFNNRQSKWLEKNSEEEFSELIEFITQRSMYPVEYIQAFLDEENKVISDEILIVDGTNKQIPQLDRYRIENKKEQLVSLGYKVKVRTVASLVLSDCFNSQLIIIYRSVLTPLLDEICQKATGLSIPVLFEVDDLIIDTKYTDLLEYTQKLGIFEKKKYDQTVNSYQKMMKKTNGIIVSTNDLGKELAQYSLPVYVNRNLISQRLLKISNEVNCKKNNFQGEKIVLGYFSGSITHNENFNLIADALAELLEKYNHLELLIVGYLKIPLVLEKYSKRIIYKEYISWDKLPELMKSVSINLAPLVDNIFNCSKSEIKWMEAALLKIPTAASNIGAFKDMIEDKKTGLVIDDDDWVAKMSPMIESEELRKKVGECAYRYVIKHCLANCHEDSLTIFIRNEV